MFHKSRVTARDIMVSNVRAVRAEDRVFDCTKMLTSNAYSGAPVVDRAGDLVGMLSEHHCIKAFLSAVHHQTPPSTVGDVMTREVVSVDENASILEVADLMVRKRLRRLPVVRGTRLVGQISRRDLLKQAVKIFEGASSRDQAILYLSALDRNPPV